MLKVINIISDTNVGGAGKCVVNYANNFTNKSIDLTIILPNDSKLIELFKNNNVKIIQIDGLKDKSFDIKSYFKLRKIFKSVKPDIVHTHSSIIARIVAKFSTRAKIIYTKHCDYNLGKKENNLLYKFLYKIINLFFSNNIIAVSKSVKENLINRGIPSDKIDVILNGVPRIKKENNVSKILKLYNINKEDFVVSIIARLVDDKDQKTLIDVAKMFSDKKIDDIKFLIVGIGANEEKLHRYTEQLNLKNVVFTGFISEINKILSITDLQVNCSIGTEATSLALLEGLSIGIPIVATNYGGNSGIVKNGYNGYLVPIKDVSSFYKKINELKENKKIYNQYKENSLRIYDELFSIEKYVNSIEKIYFS